jgi:hypothetical protein
MAQDIRKHMIRLKAVLTARHGKINFNNIYILINQPSKDEVLKQVLAGLKSVNQSLGTNYKLSHI